MKWFSLDLSSLDYSYFAIYWLFFSGFLTLACLPTTLLPTVWTGNVFPLFFALLGFLRFSPPFLTDACFLPYAPPTIGPFQKVRALFS